VASRSSADRPDSGNGRGAGSSAARAAVLQRIRSATRGEPLEVAVPRDYATRSPLAGDALNDRFAERVSSYRASVHRSAPDEVAERVIVLARELGARRVAVAPGVPDAWRPDGVEVVVDHGLAASALDRIDGAVTGCALAIAETGTLVLDGGPRCGRRALTLVPDWHVCVVEAGQVVGSVPEVPARPPTSSSAAWRASTARGRSTSCSWRRSRRVRADPMG
jgi:L-lactate dehydrogenase complex protein LldG